MSTKIEEDVIIDGFKYIQSITKSITQSALSDDSSVRELSKSVYFDMRVNLSVPVIYSSLVILNRCAQYMKLAYMAKEMGEKCKYPSSQNSVDHTVKILVMQWLSQIRTISRIESEWRDSEWNPIEIVQVTLEKVIKFNMDKSFGIQLENYSL